MEDRKKYDVIISEQAATLLEGHAAFLSKVSQKAAERFISSFVVAAKSLEDMPERCPWINLPYIPFRRYKKLLFCKRYMIVFSLCDRTVYISYVIDTRQEYQWILSNE